MPNRSSKRGQGPEDINQIAFRVVQQATGQMPKEQAPDPDKNPAAVTLGRLGGLKGGAARAKSLSQEERKRIAKKAALARWKSAQDDSTATQQSDRPLIPAESRKAP
jgi:hypothetical protein